MNFKTEKLWSIREIAKHQGLSVDTIKDCIKKNELFGAINVGTKRRKIFVVPDSAYQAYLDSRSLDYDTHVPTQRRPSTY